MARKTAESEDDFIRMQQEAIRRVRDMQQRARSTLESAGVPLESHEAARPAPPPVNTPKPAPPPAREGHTGRPATQSVWNAPAMHPAVHAAPEPAAGSFSSGYSHAGFPPAPPRAPVDHERAASILSPLLGNLLPSVNISLDSEQILLMILIFLLYQDDADKFLILAVAYVLLI
jgi:hypothetical protein